MKKLFFPFVLILASMNTFGQAKMFSTAKWLQDATTLPLGDTAKRIKFKNSFNGIRLLFEPQLGYLFQSGINKIEDPNIKSLSRFGVESNLLKGYVSLQFGVVFPSRVQYDKQSEYRVKGHVIDSLGYVDVDYGLTIGFSFFDGMIAVGVGSIFFDKRDFQNTAAYKHFVYQNNYVYLNIQPVSAIKALVKELRD